MLLLCYSDLCNLIYIFEYKHFNSYIYLGGKEEDLHLWDIFFSTAINISHFVCNLEGTTYNIDTAVTTDEIPHNISRKSHSKTYKITPKTPFLSKSFHLFSCTGKTHYLCKSSAQKKEQNQTFIPFKFQTIGNQLV